jgi:hypothetical protein
VQTFCQYLRSKRYEVKRLQVSPEGEVKPIFSDLYVPEIPLLVEAKGTVERGSIRMALGQLLDYRRFVAEARCAILVPSRAATIQRHAAVAWTRPGVVLKCLAQRSKLTGIEPQPDPGRSNPQNVLVWIQNQLPSINRIVDALPLELPPQAPG